MAVDLGSTMVDSCLIDAEDKGVLAQRSIKNPQRFFRCTSMGQRVRCGCNIFSSGVMVITFLSV